MAVIFLLIVSCTSHRPRTNIETIQQFRVARDSGDLEKARSFIAPGARLYFEEKKGEGEPYSLGGGRYEHWDEYFHSETKLSGWREEGNAVTATVTETNDFMKMLEWEPKPYTITWWINARGQIAEALIKSTPGKAKSRLAEFEAWARVHHPDELAYLMPNDRIDPTGDRPERWTKILQEWISRREAREPQR